MSRGPIPDKPADRVPKKDVLAAARMFVQQPGHKMGGCLHSVIDDGNLEDRCILDAMTAAINGRCQCGRPVCKSGEMLATMLLNLTRTQRKFVYRNIER